MYKIKRFNKTSDDAKRTGKETVGAGLIIGGGSLIRSSNKEGELTGRIKLHHSTARKNVDSIMRNGIDGVRALDDNNLTNQELGGLGKKDGRHLIYTAKDKGITSSVSDKRLNNGVRSKNLELSIPYNKFKEMHTEGNPETFNAKTFKEYAKKVRENYPDDPITDKELKDRWKKIGGHSGSRTVLLEGKLSPEHIKGSKSYKRLTPSEVTNYIKNNPKRFLKGAAKATAGTAVVIGGVELMKNNSPESNHNLEKGLVTAAGLGLGAKVTKDSLDSVNEKSELLKKYISSKSSGSSDDLRKEIDKLRSSDKFRNMNPREAHSKILDEAMESISKKRSAEDKFRKKANVIVDKATKSGKLKSIGKGALVAGSTIGSYIVLDSIRRKKARKKSDE